MTASSDTVAGTPLLDEGIRAVNFFNGRLVTGGDLTRDQEARRTGDARLGQAIGPGVVQGLDVQVAGDPKDQKLRVSKGLALNAQGQALALGNDQVLALAPEEDEVAVAAGDTFGDCKPLSGGTYVAGEGVYLVTLAPALRKSGTAQVLALEPGNLRCNSDVVVEGVQLRVVQLRPELLDDHGFDTEVRDPKPVSLLRSALAAACFGHAPGASARARVPQAAGATLLDDLLADNLDPRDVPLALVFLNADDGLKFVDTWAVRRQVGASVASAGWAPWFGEPREAVAQARIAQFQQHLADVRRDAGSANLKAADWFQWLPPAGFLARSGDDAVRWESFLDPRQPAREVALAAGDAPAVLAEALRRDPVPLANGASPRFRVYAVDGGPSLFARDARNARHAEEVWFDAQRSGIAANEVQGAIEKLWARSCVSFVLHDRDDAHRLESFAKEMRGRDVVLCVESGEFDVGKTLVLRGLRHLVIHGHGAGSLLRSGMDAALRIEQCASVFISDLALDARGEEQGKDEWGIGIAGALTVIDTPEVHVLRVQATCAERAVAAGGFKGNERAKAAAMVLTHSEKGLKEDRPRRVRVEDCELRAGAGQQGLGCFHWQLLTVQGNLVVAQGGKQPMLAGIVLGGAMADEVRVERNAVAGALRGVWLALSVHDQKSDPRHLQVGHAVLARNRIQVIAASGDKAPGVTGIYVGNVESLLVEGNHLAVAGAAVLEESRRGPTTFLFAGSGEEARAIEEGSAQGRGLHLAGVYGPRLVVRDNHLRGFPRPVQFELKGETGPESVLWLFAGNLAERAKMLVDAERPVLERLRDDNNQPPVRS